MNPATVTAQTRDRMGILADHMANGCASILCAATDLGWTQATTERLWKLVRRELGWQAV